MIRWLQVLAIGLVTSAVSLLLAFASGNVLINWRLHSPTNAARDPVNARSTVTTLAYPPTRRRTLQTRNPAPQHYVPMQIGLDRPGFQEPEPFNENQRA